MRIEIVSLVRGNPEPADGQHQRIIPHAAERAPLRDNAITAGWLVCAGHRAHPKIFPMRAATVTLLLSALVLAGCSQTAEIAPPDEPDLEGSELNVVTAFYPLSFTTQQVAGDLLLVEPLVEPDALPRDTELGEREKALVEGADIVVTLNGYLPALDQLTEGRDNVIDVAQAARLAPRQGVAAPQTSTASPSVSAPEPPTETGSTDTQQVDPYFWLDPIRLAQAGTFIAEQLGEVDPDNATRYEANAQQLAATLEQVDNNYRLQLSGCESTNLVTTQPSFGYLADRYGFTPVPVQLPAADAGPEDPAVRRINDFVTTNAVTTIYAPPGTTQAQLAPLTEHVDVSVGTLDPMTAVLGDSPGRGYDDIVQANLQVLKEGQRCAGADMPAQRSTSGTEEETAS
ncbi:MAG: hypothetical protein CSA58_04855 [Micrococcales bacterium]|nr:MAG: hypothetical protein CSA58_04855 [Micrococcales bacterium]